MGVKTFKNEPTNPDNLIVFDEIETVKKLSGIVNARQFGIIANDVVGDSETIQTMINKVRTDVIKNGLTSFVTVEIPSGTYIIDKEIKMSPYIKLKSNGIVIFKITFNGTAFWISPNADDPKFSATTLHLNKNIWNRGDYFDGTNGTFLFMTSLDKATTGNKTAAIEFGDRSNTSSRDTPISRYTIQNVAVIGLDTAFKWNSVNHYIGSYVRCHIESNNHAVHLTSQNNGSPINSGENFVFENCVIAGHKKESILLECAGHDISFNNCSFDFNASPVIKSVYSGICVRVNNSYLEKIGAWTPAPTDEQLFFLTENKIAGTDYRRSSFYTKNFVIYLKRPAQFIKNVANSNGSFINWFVDLDIEMRYDDTDVLAPYHLLDRYLMESGQNITILRHRIIDTTLRKNLVSKDVNLLSNGDFSKSALNANLFTASSDPYWLVDFKANTTDPIIVGEGIANTNCLKWTVNTAGNNSIRLTSLYKYPVEAGEFMKMGCLYKTDKIDNLSSIVYRFECYDSNDVLINTINFYDYLTSAVGIQTVDATNFRMSRSIGTAQVPAGTTKVKPIILFVNMQGDTMWVDDIHFSKSK